MWSLLEKAVNSSAAALDVVKRDAAEFCRTVTEDTSNFMNGSADSPFGNPKHGHRAPTSQAHGVSSTEDTRRCDDVINTSPTYDRQQAQLERIQNDADTYSTQPEPIAHYERWCSAFDLDGHTAEISKVLMKQSVRSHHATLVPGSVMPREFWLRYFYRLDLLKQDDERRAALKAFALQPVENELESWDDEEGWEEGGDWQAIADPASSSPLPGSSDCVDSVQTSLADMFLEEHTSACAGTAATLTAADRDAQPCAAAASGGTPPSNTALPARKRQAHSAPGTSPQAATATATAAAAAAAASLAGSGSAVSIPSSLSLDDIADSSTASSNAADGHEMMSSSSERSSGCSTPPSSPPLLPHSPGKSVSARNRRARQLALLKHRQSQASPGQGQASSGHTVASASSASAGKWRKPSDVRDARMLKSMMSSSSADDDATDGEVKAQVSGRACRYSATAEAGSPADSNANDETSGSEIVVLSVLEDTCSQQSVSAAASPPCRHDIMVTRFKSAAGIASPPPSSYGSDFELVSETEPSETTSPLHRPLNLDTAAADTTATTAAATAATTAAATASAASTESTMPMAVAMRATSLSIVSSDTTLQNMKMATPEKCVNSEEDWESWD